MRATVPAVQVRGNRSYGTCLSSQQARLGPWVKKRNLNPGHLLEKEEEEGLFKADAVNEEDPERDRATQV